MPPYRPWFSRRVGSRAMDAFWARMDDGHLHRLKQARLREKRKGAGFDPGLPISRSPAPVTPTTLGRVRYFEHPHEVRAYVSLRTRLVRAARKKRQHVIFFPAPILGIDAKYNRLCERVFPFPNALSVIESVSLDVLSTKSRYARSFKRLLEKRKISFSMAKELIATAIEETIEVSKNEVSFDDNPENFVVVDFDPATRKPIFVLIDLL